MHRGYRVATAAPMGCGASAEAPTEPQQPTLARNKEPTSEEAQAQDAGLVFRQFHAFLAGFEARLEEGLSDATAEERCHAKHQRESTRARAVLNKALGGLTALEVIERDRVERKNLADDGTMVKTWDCKHCTKTNAADVPMCTTCSRLRFEDDDADPRKQVDYVLAVRQAELRATSREAMATLAATAPTAKRLRANRRRLRAVSAASAELAEIQRLNLKVTAQQLDEADQQVEAAEAALAAIDDVLVRSMNGKASYLQAQGAKEFVSDPRNLPLFLVRRCIHCACVWCRKVCTCNGLVPHLN